MRRWHLGFADPDVEARYRAERAPAARRRLRVLFPPLLALWLGAVWFDLTAPSPMGERNSLIRFAVGGPVFLASTVFSYAASDPLFARWWSRILTSTYAVLLGSTVALTAVAVGPYVPHAVIGFLMVLMIGGAMVLVELRALVVVAALGGAAELTVLALHPETTAFDVSAHATWIVVGLVAVVILGWQLEAFQRRLFLQRAETQALLRNVMPEAIAARLQANPDAIADHFEGVTVLFADIAGFTGLAARMGPEQLVARLDDVFSRVDDIVHRHGLEKIKTIGDQYMAVAGAPTPRADHACAAARVALEICALEDPHVRFRVGLASGPVVAGVIGKSRFSYDLWGDTVNLASRMESHGVPGKVQVDARARELLAREFVLEERGLVEIKGKGPVTTWFVVGER